MGDSQDKSQDFSSAWGEPCVSTAVLSKEGAQRGKDPEKWTELCSCVPQLKTIQNVVVSKQNIQIKS